MDILLLGGENMFKKWIVFLLLSLLLFPISTYAKEDLYLGGDSIGIVVNYDGVLVSGTYQIEKDGKFYNPSNQDILKGDMIVKVGNNDVHSLEDLYASLNNYQKDINEIDVTLVRGTQSIHKSLISIYDKKNETFQCGLYVKDSIAGVGTMTYYNPSNMEYGALGHEIQDVDLKEKAKIDYGTIYEASVHDIVKSQNGVIGEKHANINYNEVIGNVKENKDIGIYGNYQKLPNKITSLPWTKQDKVHLGDAQIYTVLSNQDIKAYKIKITKLNIQNESEIKGIEYEVIDPELLKKSGGIIQGMSGSPIVQDEHIIGAVSHVITSNAIKGYGVYIEWMMK